ncbi:MAG: hypothetical protein ACRD2B_12550 [Terriglobia bacterium]
MHRRFGREVSACPLGYNRPMADNLERTMQFIVEQQAQFTVDIQKLQQRQEAITTMIRQLVDVGMSLAHHGDETDQRIQQLTKAQADTDRHIKELTEAQTHTDRRLDALIDVVDKVIRRNGGD